MALVIPWQNSPDFQFEVSLDGTVYLIRFRWNVLAEAWAMDLFSRASTPLILGVRVASNVDLIAPTVTEAPPGAMFVMGDEPTYDGMIGGSSQIVYLTGAEIGAL